MKKTRRRKRATTMLLKTCTPMTYSSPRVPNSTTAIIANWTCGAKSMISEMSRSLPEKLTRGTGGELCKMPTEEVLVQSPWLSQQSTIL